VLKSHSFERQSAGSVRGVIRGPRLVDDATEGTVQEIGDVDILGYLDMRFWCSSCGLTTKDWGL
jgi:hypothetical protein